MIKKKLSPNEIINKYITNQNIKNYNEEFLNNNNITSNGSKSPNMNSNDFNINAFQEENFCFTMKLLKELCPNKTHYGNLLPYWSGLLAESKEKNREDAFYYEKIEDVDMNIQKYIRSFKRYLKNAYGVSHIDYINN